MIFDMKVVILAIALTGGRHHCGVLANSHSVLRGGGDGGIVTDTKQLLLMEIGHGGGGGNVRGHRGHDSSAIHRGSMIEESTEVSSGSLDAEYFVQQPGGGNDDGGGGRGRDTLHGSIAGFEPEVSDGNDLWSYDDPNGRGGDRLGDGGGNMTAVHHEDDIEGMEDIAAAANPCFANRNELKGAVDRYIDEEDCANNNECDVGKTYGWPINSWCVSEVTDISRLFQWKGTFNEDISDWDISQVTNMNMMFSHADSFNCDLSSWNVSNVTDMGSMFSGAYAFDGDLSSWDVTSVTNMWYMFAFATSFNQDLCAWGDRFPYSSASVIYNIFKGSGCTVQDTPQLEQRGPFCASSCTSPNGAATVGESVAAVAMSLS
mmetsp:Transcript_14573/g.26315  ORF Transcript_14573/g.26315 Transcript_14573/m.26315 type:complete len:374 (-) Transcript_14573:173-1294(-)|eukprot:CAMPEP_0201894478 /NCGR_PEP_ID=MMETSP0902-20130614/40796_1 /ASSEMBLY_ACC=CAM_ASM_000551 /TAXON_ID=420261 /ORGANISM="Thalassiosira antarctica, Strain CCMP982" /LENGTH=373 /DNA_ID=CAMNT_0048426533 /DNA_START=96 /DNA_END=1217 /DNA_ORIENTATION=-